MTKLFFTAVLMTTGVAFASAQSTETKNNETAKTGEAATGEVVKDSATQEPAKAETPATMTNPNAEEQPADSGAKKQPDNQPAAESKKTERAKKK